MKNIHVIPTEKPRTYKGGKVSTFTAVSSMMPTESVYNIYITSDEEIKEGDWIYNIVSKNIFKASKQLIDLINDPNVTLTTNKKIILTTDQDLIKDGVQAIDDEFLEWFVQNSSCEQVEVYLLPYDGTKSISKYWGGEYKIIIPKEEQKQALIDMMKSDEESGLYDQEIKLEDVFNDEKRQGVKELINTHKQRPEKYSERFDNDKSEIGNPDTWGKRVIEEPKQTDENGKSITYWGGLAELKQENCCTPVGQIKRYIDCIGCDCKPKQETLEEAVNAFKKTDIYVNEIKQETLEDIKLEEVLGSSYCKYTVIENKLATIYRNQEKILSAIKLLSNEK
jgi:hypothetical protein